LSRTEPNRTGGMWIRSDLPFVEFNERNNGQELDRRINVDIPGYTRVDRGRGLYVHIHARALGWRNRSITLVASLLTESIACEELLRRSHHIVCSDRDMISWRRKSSSAGCKEMRERLIEKQASGSSSCVPRGCVAVLVGDEEPGERVVVEVRALGQPCVRALLEVAEREFGYDQKGVLRIPCPADEFRRAVAADSTAAAAGGGGHHHHRR
jgi:SAUR family protein